MTTYTWKFLEAEDDSVDSVHELHADGESTGIHVQDCRSYGGRWTLGKLILDHKQRVEGVAYLGDHPTLAAAKAAGVAWHEATR